MFMIRMRMVTVVRVLGVRAGFRRERRVDRRQLSAQSRDHAFEHMIAPGVLAGVHIFFPDPWPKKRHHKRRLIQPDFAHLVATRLQPGGYLHAATDWAEYADQMIEVLEPVYGPAAVS